MFTPERSPSDRFEGQNPKTKDVVFCEGSAFPLAVPSPLVAAIWEQVNEGVRAVPRGGVEVGGLLLGRPVETGIVLAEEIVPIQIEYHFGPFYRFSTTDLTAIQSLMASVQKDPSKAVVGFYRSRTRNDSRSQESDSELLAVLEQAHTSFATNFHYYIAFTPLSKMSMTASVSLRKDGGWDDWQHSTLRSNPLSALEPIEVEVPPKASPNPAPTLEQPPARSPVATPLVAHSEPHTHVSLESYAPAQVPTRALVHPESRSPSHPDCMPAGPAALEPWNHFSSLSAFWYICGSVLLAAIIGFGAHFRLARPPQRRAPATAAAVRTGFSATREGPLWRLTWDREVVAARNPTGAVLAIRDGGKEQQIGLTLSDLSSGTILYRPQTGDLLFSLNIVMPGSQLTEEHVRVLEAPRVTKAPSEPSVKIVVRDEVRTLRPFNPATKGPDDSSAGKSSVPEMPPPPFLATAANPPLSSAIPTSPPPIEGASGPRGNREIPVNTVPVVPSPAPPLSAPGAPAPVTVGPKVVSRVSPTFSGPIPSGATPEVRIRVQIDAQGAVTKVTPIAPNAINFRMVDAAAAAARFWVFEPAKTEGHPVPSEMILEFHFGGR
jgi:hypothetical protein